MTHPNLERAHQLLQQNRGSDAERYIRQALESSPEDPFAFYLLSVALLQQDKDREALDAVQAAIALEPENPSFHYQLATARYQLRDWKEAEASARHSLELYPENADAFGLLAFLKARQAKWEESLQLAESGLRIDSDHVTCTNARANALTKLRRADQASDSLDYALKRDPENPYTHFQKGQLLLETRKYDEAAHHFCEALRLEPDFEDAKAGLVEALKGKHLLYSLFLRYIFFMGRLSSGTQMAIIFGGFFAQRFISAMFLNAGQPGIAIAIRVTYGLLAFFTWTASSLFNLLLFLHPLGRHALDPLQKRVAAAVAAILILAIGSFALYLLGDFPDLWLATLAIAFNTLLTSSIDRIPQAGKRRLVIGISLLQGLLALGSFAALLTGNLDLGATLATPAMLIAVAYTWLSGFFRS